MKMSFYPKLGPKPPFHLPVVLAAEHQGQEDIVLDGKGVQEVKVLEHEPRAGAVHQGRGGVPPNLPGEQHQRAALSEDIGHIDPAGHARCFWPPDTS